MIHHSLLLASVTFSEVSCMICFWIKSSLPLQYESGPPLFMSSCWGLWDWLYKTAQTPLRGPQCREVQKLKIAQILNTINRNCTRQIKITPDIGKATYQCILSDLEHFLLQYVHEKSSDQYTIQTCSARTKQWWGWPQTSILLTTKICRRYIVHILTKKTCTENR